MMATILVVDDIPTNVKLLEARLSSENYNVISSYNGADAFAACLSQNIDIILSDITMPQMDGFELCSRLKSNVKTKNIPIILVTGLEEEFHKAHAFQIGADDFITKPISGITLMTRVKNLLIQKKLKDEINRTEGTLIPAGQNLPYPTSSFKENNSRAEGRILLLDICGRIITKIVPVLSKIHDVFVENSYNKAIHTLDAHQFDIFMLHVCDLNEALIEFYSALRSMKKTLEIPKIIVTDSNNDTISLALKSGINDFVLCPINHYDLLSRLNVHLTNKRLADHLEFIKGSLAQPNVI